MRVLCVVLCGLMVVPAAAEGIYADRDDGMLNVPRTSLPSAHLLGKQNVAVSYTFGAASHEGRDLQSDQFAVTGGVTDRIEVAFDYNDIDVNGRTAGNTFDVHATGWQVRYGQELFGEPGAVWLQYRASDGRVVTGGNTRIPPDATAVTLGAVRSQAWGDKNEVHAVASLTRSEVGGENALTWMGGAGIDRELSRGLTARGDLALFKETGEVDGFEAAISGGLHYETRSGFTADVMGTFLPSGTPLAGNSLADGTVFILDPVFRNEPIVRDLQDDALGFFTVRVGYTTDF